MYRFNLFQPLPLFKGCPVTISVTCKGKLRQLDKDPDATDKEYTYAILDDLFDSTTLANMTAKGRTRGSIKIDRSVKDNILSKY